MPATPRIVDLENVEYPLGEEKIINIDGRELTRKQARARLRRRIAAGKEPEPELLMMMKPIEEWDIEELARGRPRAKDGSFRGIKPKWITREVHDEAVERFKSLVKAEMNGLTVDGLKTIQLLLANDEEDNRGRPIVAASTKLDAAKFLLEHVVGKPTQPIKGDISVKLQAILGHVMVNPTDDVGGQELPTGGYAPSGYAPAHFPQMGVVVEGEVLDDE